MQKPQGKNHQQRRVNDIAQSCKAKAELRTPAAANGSRPTEQVDVVLQGSPRPNHRFRSYRAQPKRRNAKRASANEMMDISIIVPVEDVQDEDELIETIMTRRVGAQGAQTRLKEPMIAQKEREGAQYADRLYRKDEPSSSESPDTKEARDELTQPDLEFRAAETSRRQEVRSIMSKSTDPKIFDSTTNMWQKYPEAIVKDVVLNVQKTKAENDYGSLETRRSYRRRQTRPIKVELSFTAPSSQRASLAATKKQRSSRRGKDMMTMHSTQMELEDYTYQQQLKPRAMRKIYPHVLSGSDYCSENQLSMRYQHIVKNLNISELAGNFQKQKEEWVKEELLRLQNEQAEEELTPVQRSISNNTQTKMKSNFDSGTFEHVSEQVWLAKMKQTQQDYADGRINDRCNGGISRGVAESWLRKSNEVKMARRAQDEGDKSSRQNFQLYGQQPGPSQEAKGGSQRYQNSSFNNAKHSAIEATIPATQERTAEVAGQTSHVGTLTEHQSEMKLMQELSGKLVLQSSSKKIGAANAVGQKEEQAAEIGDASTSHIPEDYRSDSFSDKFIRYSKPHTYAPHLQKALQRLLDSQSSEKTPQIQVFNTTLTCPQIPGTDHSSVVDLNGQIQQAINQQSFEATNMHKFAKFDQQISMRIRNTTRQSEDSARITDHEPVGTTRIRPNSPTDTDSQLLEQYNITANIGRQSDHAAPSSRDQATGAEQITTELQYHQMSQNLNHTQYRDRVLAVKHTHISEEISYQQSSNQTSHYCIVTDPDARPGCEGDEGEQGGDPKEMKEDDDLDVGLNLDIHEGGDGTRQQSKTGHTIAIPQLRLQKTNKQRHSPLGLKEESQNAYQAESNLQSTKQYQLWEQQPVKNIEPLVSTLVQSLQDPSYLLASRNTTTLIHSHHSSTNAIHEVPLFDEMKKKKDDTEILQSKANEATDYHPAGNRQGQHGHTDPTNGCASPARAKREKPVEYKTYKEIVREAIMKGNHGKTQGRHSKLMGREMKTDLIKGKAVSEGHSVPKTKQIPQINQLKHGNQINNILTQQQFNQDSIESIKQKPSAQRVRERAEKHGKPMQRPTPDSRLENYEDRAEIQAQRAAMAAAQEVWALQARAAETLENYELKQPAIAIPSQPFADIEEDNVQKEASIVHRVNKIHLSGNFGASHEDLHVNEQATDQTWLQGSSPSPRLTSHKRLALTSLPISGAERSPRAPQGGTSRRSNYGLQQILDDENSLNSSRMQAQTLDLSTVNIGEAFVDPGKAAPIMRPSRYAEVMIKHSRGDTDMSKLTGTKAPKNQIIIERIREMESLEEVQNLRRTLQENIIQMSGLQRDNANKSLGAVPEAARAQAHSSYSASPQRIGQSKFPSRGGSLCERRSLPGPKVPYEGDQESQRETMRTAAGGGVADLPIFGAGWSTRPPKVLKEKVPGRSPATSALGHTHTSNEQQSTQIQRHLKQQSRAASRNASQRNKSRTIERRLQTIDHQSLKIDNSPEVEGRLKGQEKKLDMSVPVHDGTSPISDRSLLLDLDYMALLSANLELLQIKEQELKEDRERDYVSRNIQMHTQELAGFHKSELKPMEYKFQGPTLPSNEHHDGTRRISTTNQKLLHMFRQREGRQFLSLSQQQKALRLKTESDH